MEITINNQVIQVNSQKKFWELVNNGSWEPQSFTVLDTQPEKGKVFVDIGAWNGVLSIYANKKYNTDCFCFEPDDVARVILRENVKNNNCKGIIVNNFAISDKVGLAKLKNNSLGDSNSSLIRSGGQEYIVPTLPLSAAMELVVGEIGLIKMDTEGAEVLVLPQAKDWLRKVKPKMYVSFHPAYFESLKTDVLKLVESIFPIYKVYGTIYNNNEYRTKDFIAAMSTPHDHAFLLLPK